MAIEKLKLTRKQIQECYIGCCSLGQHELTVWEEVDKNIIALQSLVEEYEKKRKTIIEKYAKKDDKGEVMIVDGKYYDFEKNFEKANKLLTDLSNEELEVDIHQFDKAELKGIKLVPNLMRPLRGVVFIGE